MSEEAMKKRMDKFCHHCEKDVSKSTFYRHLNYETVQMENGDNIDEENAESALVARLPHLTEDDIGDDSAGNKQLRRQPRVLQNSSEDEQVVRRPSACHILDSSEDEQVVRRPSARHIVESSEDEQMPHESKNHFEESSEDNDTEDNSAESGQSSSEDQEVWSEEEALTDEPDTEHHSGTARNEQNGVMAFLLSILSTWKALFKISDRAFEAILKIFKSFLLFLSSIICNTVLQNITKDFPATLYMLRKKLAVKCDFTKFVVCPKCHCVYTFDEAIIKKCDGSGKVLQRKSNKCGHVTYPRHTQKRFRRPCDTVLMRSVIGKDGKEFLYPKRQFCYRSLIKSLGDMFKRPGFKESCEKWRQRNVKEGLYADVFDGQVWKDFLKYKGKPFLEETGNLGLMLNVDWFQPYNNIRDSVGVIYIAVMNLPREIRFKKENMIVAGIIPGPHEPKEHINGFLEPLVSDLNKLWTGLFVDDGSATGQFVRAALLCLACDIPAARKTGGFLSHMATKGCSKCLKDFARTQDNKVDYSGFDETWPIRNNVDHCRYAKEAKRAINKANKTRIEQKYGARYSCLHDLPYFDVVRMHVIDPMHNLLEGTAKRLMQVWKDTDAITKEGFVTIQDRVNSLKLPSTIDSGIPSKIEAAFEGFTAAQWKLWVCVYSTFALKGVLGEADYKLWKIFVAAVQLMCSRVIDNAQIEDAHRCLKIFCNSFEKLYGKDWCTMNLHLHLHLKSCIKDYGPVHGFWCFSFERANGILGDYHSNNRDTEVNMMRKWLTEWQMAGEHTICPVPWASCDPDIKTLLQGVPSSTVLQADNFQVLHNLIHGHITDDNFEFDNTVETLLPPVKCSTMTISDNSSLFSMFKVMYPNDKMQ